MGWYNLDWNFRRKIAIQNGNIDSDQTDFPVYVPISSDSNFSSARADGYDIRFTQSDGITLLKYERESWTGGGGSAATANFWVKSNITSATETEIYIYYGYSSASDGEDKNNVWDSNFWGVYHMNDSLEDSTGNGNTLIKSHAGITAVTGIVANGYEIADVPEYLYVGATVGDSPPFTEEIWGSGTMEEGAQIVYIGDVDSANEYSSLREEHTGGGGFYEAIASDGASTGEATTSNATSDDTWFYGVARFQLTNARQCYLDADVANKGTDTTFVSNIADTDRTAFGALARATPAGGFTGILDEARISDIVRPEAYIKFVYANINEGDNELTWSPQETIANSLFFGTVF